MDSTSDSNTPSAPIHRDWEASYQRGDWDFLSGMGEAPRNCLIAGFVHRLIGGGHVLDVGCGEGVLLDYLDLGRVSYSGFDISTAAIERAQKRTRGAKVDLFTSSMDDFQPLTGERYDIVIFNETLSHSHRPIDTLRRFSTC